MTPQWWRRYAAIAVLILTALVFAPFLNDYLWLDDAAWINGAGQASSLAAWVIVPGGVFPYRPLTAGLFALLGPAFGCVPWPYRLIALALHLVNVMLALVLARRLLGDERAALAAAALWAIYPVHRWAVLWIADLSGVLATTFALGCLLAYDRYLQEREARWYGLAVLGLVLAVMTKETFLALPLALVLIDVLRQGRGGMLAAAKRLAPFALVTLILAAPVAVAYSLRPGGGDTNLLSARLPANVARAMLFLVLPMINPNAINGLDLSGLSLPFRVDLNRSALLAAAPVALVWLALLWRARSLRAWLLSLWAPGLLVTASVTGFLLLPFKGRYLYLPALGFCMLLALVWRRLDGALHDAQRPAWVRHAPAVLLGLAVAGLALFNTQQQWWVRNPERPGSLLSRYVWSGLLGCRFTPDEIRAEAVREGIASVAPAAAAPLPAPANRTYLVSLASRALAREITGDLAGAREDVLAARSLALQGDLDTRDKESYYLIPQAQVLGYLDAQWARLATEAP